ncbi:S8 family peptidase [Pseudobdellovibrio exovorus]|uniref:Peptidase S8/S53 domain-containing protein n=1 Tax=Pseudobdellovibrio exovorus JSS TaxID=1184267 RepID=M4VNH6_9BACT|nr:S8 family peptidase [Pseudobdellovibrio exovorus]AGH94654.1 hypothetical protein A11Q_434 [Pseudobdellovibrio exovorus JSS]
MKAQFILGLVLSFSLNTQAAIPNTTPDHKPKADIQKELRQDIVVAVIDTGADINHKDLKDYIWINEGESGLDRLGRNKATNGLDDDGNGFVDDVHGWNFVKNNNDVSDQEGHGTHISGIIQQEFEKQRTSSTSPQSVRLMILKYYDANAEDEQNVMNTVKAIEYATKMNARIINYSGGGESPFSLEFKALQQANQQGILLVAAAGNNNSNTDLRRFYPANYPLQNIISVAATDKDGELVSFSNYGSNSIDIAAIGQQVLSTLPNNKYGRMSGTSQATAYVTGVSAALLTRSRRPAHVPNLLKELLAMSTYKKSLKGKTKFQMAMIQ